MTLTTGEFSWWHFNHCMLFRTTLISCMLNGAAKHFSAQLVHQHHFIGFTQAQVKSCFNHFIFSIIIHVIKFCSCSIISSTSHSSILFTHTHFIFFWVYGQSKYQMVINSNVRDSPIVNSSTLINSIPADAIAIQIRECKNVGDGNRWCYIKYQIGTEHIQGWVNAKYLTTSWLLNVNDY